MTLVVCADDKSVGVISLKNQALIDDGLARINQRIAKARNATPVDGIVEPASNVAVVGVQLPLWPETVRRLPNEFFRSALFTARNRKQPRTLYREHTEVFVVGGNGGGGRITYKGEELRQDDEKVWLQLIHMARERPLSQLVEFTPYSFCKAIRWPICNASYKRLRECLDRMQAPVAVYSKRLKTGVSLAMIPYFEWHDENQRTLKKYRAQVAPQLLELFGDEHYTQVEWAQRLDLPDGIATWLHGYYASHREPYAVKLDTIKKGAGISTDRPAKVRELIKMALAELKKVGFLQSWEIVGDLVHVKRKVCTNSGLFR